MKNIPLVSSIPFLRPLGKLSHNGLYAVTIGVCAMLASQAHAATETLYESDFSSNRDGWYNSNSGTGLYTSNGQLKCINSSGQFLTYFSNTTLDVGESLTFNFGITLESVNDANSSLRIGLLNSGGSENQVSADDFGYSDAIFNNYEGYRITTNPGSPYSGKTALSKRGTPNSSPLGSNPWTSIGGGANGVNLSANTAYPVTITLSRTDDTIIAATFSMNGVLLSESDIAADNFTYDTLIFYKGSDAGGNIMLDDVQITYTSVPEPSQMSLMLGVLILLTLTGLTRRIRS